MEAQVSVRKINNAPILSLIDRAYLKSTANIPRSIWEAMSYLYSEADQQTERVKIMAIRPENEWMRIPTLQAIQRRIAWLDELLLESQSIDALRSWQMVRGLENAQGATERPSGTIIPPFPQPTPPGTAKPRNGILKRGGQA